MAETKTSTAMVRVDPATVARLDELAEQALALRQEARPFARALATAAVMQGIRDELAKPGVLAAVKALQGTAVGFRTDRDSKGGYSERELADFALEAAIRGTPIVGDCCNVIGGRYYLTKAGAGYHLARIDGLADLRVVCDPPKTVPGGALVTAHLTWQYRGAAGRQDLDIPIRVNEGMGADAILGKATRKARVWLLGYLTGSEIPEGEVDDPAERARNVTPSPFEAATPAPATEAPPAPEPPPVPAGPDWNRASPEAIAAEVDRIRLAAGISTDQMEAWAMRHGYRGGWQAVPVAIQRQACLRPDAWLGSVFGGQEGATNA
jgi:hypothetical protein